MSILSLQFKIVPQEQLRKDLGTDRERLIFFEDDVIFALSVVEFATILHDFPFVGVIRASLSRFYVRHKIAHAAHYNSYKHTQRPWAGAPHVDV